MEINYFNFVHQLFSKTIFIIFFNLVLHIFADIINNNNNSNDNFICDSEICQTIAENIKRNMNLTEDPCNDFYEYTCGNWTDEHEDFFSVTREKVIYQLKELLEEKLVPEEKIGLKKAQLFYKSCMDEKTIRENGMKSFVKVLDEYGGWPMIMDENTSITKNSSWFEIDLEVRRSLNVSPFISISVEIDSSNSSLHQIRIFPASINSKYFFEDKDLKNFTIFMESPKAINYTRLIKNIAKLIARHKKFNLSDELLEKDAIEIIRFEWELKKTTRQDSKSILEIIDYDFNKISIRELNKMDENNYYLNNKKSIRIDWQRVIDHYFSDIPNTNINETEQVSVIQLQYFKKLTRLLYSKSSRIIVNTIYWNLIKHIGFHVNEEITGRLIHENPSLIDYKKKNRRWKSCVLRVEYFMNDAISNAYVEKYVSSATIADNLNIIQNIMNATKNQINSTDWLILSKEKTLKKINSMEAVIGNQNSYNDSIIDSIYKTIQINQFYMENFLVLKRIKLIKDRKLLREFVDKKESSLLPTKANADYDYFKNRFFLPYGILQIPFYNNKQPDAFNYGGIGSIIGHEIFHGFDVAGIQFDEKGIFKRQWWAKIDEDFYFKKMLCFMNKHDAFYSFLNKTITLTNSYKTLNENMADSQGLYAAYIAFQNYKKQSIKPIDKIKLIGFEQFTSDQLFFLSFAHTMCSTSQPDKIDLSQDNNYSPQYFRVIGSISNINNFAEAFQCPKGTKMNPHQKCGI